MWSFDEAYEEVVPAEVDGWEEYDNPDTAAHVSGQYRYAQEMRQFPRITAAEEQQLAARVQEGDESARNQLVEANLGLAHYLARFQYKRLSDNRGIYDLNDFIQAANVGLIQAAAGYRPDIQYAKTGEPVSFAGYARKIIYRAIERDCLQGATALSFSVSALAHLSKLTGATKAYMAQYGRTPTPRELAAFTDIRLNEVVMLQTYSLPPYSLYEPVEPADTEAPNFDPEDEEQVTFEETVPDSLSLPEKESDYPDLRDRISRELGQLSVNEITILQLHYGFDRADTLSLKAIAEMLHRSRPRIQRLHEQAIHQLRHQLDVLRI